MKYLKRYNESVNDKETLEELCYDLTDYGKFKIDIRPIFLRKDELVKYFGIDNENVNYIFGALSENQREDSNGLGSFTYNEVKDILHRIKDYLGDKFIKIMFATLMSTDDANNSKINTPWIDEDKLNVRDCNNIRDFIIIFKN